MMPTKRRHDLIEQDKGSSPIAGARGGEIILYNAPDGTAKLDVQLEHDTVWLSQQQMALLFDTERSVLSKHLMNIFHSGELDRTSNVQKMHIAGADRPVALYNLDVVISVGYRVNSKRGTQFRLSLIHISEPTRLGMISYAVFCLKKKKIINAKSRPESSALIFTRYKQRSRKI